MLAETVFFQYRRDIYKRYPERQQCIACQVPAVGVIKRKLSQYQLVKKTNDSQAQRKFYKIYK